MGIEKEVSVGKGWRLWLVLVLLFLIMLGISTRLLSLYVDDMEFLQTQGDARSLRVIQTAAHRGIISDRNGQPLAVSAPVATVWLDPSKADIPYAKLKTLAGLLGLNAGRLKQRLVVNKAKQFLYLKRQITPEIADKVRSLQIPYVHVVREYKRYYPAAEVATHLIGFTNLDGKGQEGIELAYDSELKASSGEQLVVKDLLGRVIKHIKEIRKAKHGNDIELSIDLRLQYLAYRELKAAVKSHRADGGSLVMLDANTGEILAMVNQPSYNPNDPRQRISTSLRNRALTDTFEPGSTVKPVTVAAALMSGKYNPHSLVNTSPGYIRVKGQVIRDHRNYGEIDVSTIITKSSNVGVTKLSLSLAEGSVRNLHHNLGLGQTTGIGFPGESTGYLPYLGNKQVVERATMSYGYGLSVTTLQLAQSYLALANDGVLTPVSLIRSEQPPEPVRVIPANIARNVREMMETVISDNGTGRRAAIQGYRVAGKTGTVHKVGGSGYISDKYISVFAGMAPVSDPRIVSVVMIDNPRGQEYYGGEVSAPVFSRAVGGALRLMNVPPDNLLDLTRAKTNVAQR